MRRSNLRQGDIVGLILRRFRHALLLGTLGALAALTPASGQEGGSEAVRSPEVHADGRVTLRRHAPDASDVKLVLAGGLPVSMSRGEEGVWSLTTEPLPPDFYTYYFLLDGAPAGDPANPIGKPVITGGQEGLLHVPGPDTLVWEEGDVPRGALDRHVYESRLFGEERELWVYTPPGYGMEGNGHRYPVLYLLHGVMEDARAWTTAGRADVILDNLIERGEVEPMLVVMPLGYGFADAPGRARELLGPIDHRPIMDAFAESLLREIVPLVERSYSVRADADSRAIAGVSMGGSQALYIGLNHSDRYRWIVSMSGALIMYAGRFDEFFPHVSASLEPVRLISMTTGTEDFLLGINRRFSEWLRAQGVALSYQDTPGGHTWGVWRRSLASIAPLLFKPTH